MRGRAGARPDRIKTVEPRPENGDKSLITDLLITDYFVASSTTTLKPTK
jgi:hypothetical protein